MIQSFGINFLGQHQSIAIGFREADDFFQPRRAGGLDVEAGAKLRDGAADRSIDGKFVAAGVDTQLERRREAVLLDGKRDDGEVVVEFFFKLHHVADVIHALVETSGELRRDGLQWNFFVRQRGKNDEQFRRRLRAVGFVHRNFGDEIRLALGLDDMPVNFPGLLHGEQIFPCDAFHFGARDRERLGDARDGNFSGEFRMAFDESLQRFRVGGFGNPVRDIERVKIRVRQKAIHRLKADMVGIHMVRLCPAKFLDGGIGGGARAGRFGADGDVFAVGLVPDRNHLDALLGSQDAGLELGLGLVRKTVTHAEGKFFDLEIFGHIRIAKAQSS